MATWNHIKFDWTIPKTQAQIFDEISHESIRLPNLDDWEDFESFHQQEAQAAYPKLELSMKAKMSYMLDKRRRKVRDEAMKPMITMKEFFKVAYEWDPFSPTGDNALSELLTSGRCDELPLGKLDGKYLYYLMPGVGALPTTGIPTNTTDFDFAHADGAAIAYEEGHPSEFTQVVRIRPNEDRTLRHMMPLGWLVRIIDVDRRIWERNGHALVMDMDEGRQHHPWIVLAESWPDDLPERENDLVYAEQEVQAGDPNVHGILPGSNQRTPIGHLCYLPKDSNRSNTPLLLSFGPDFDFGIQRFEGYKAGTSKDKSKGPPLAKVMNWYEDEEGDQLVCYDSEGKEYMRYHRDVRQYKYPVTVSTTPGQRFITLAERFANVSVSEPGRSREETGTSTGA